MNQKQKLSEMIKSEAKRLGFDACGIAKATRLKSEEKHLKYWLDRKMQGDMKFMENYPGKRVDPASFFEGTKSVISVILNYYSDKVRSNNTAPRISRYAYGEDYHSVIKRRLNRLLEFITDKINNVKGRAFVDTAPILEKAWAARTGLGWIGKNSILISPVHGSFIFIGTLLIDSELYYDKPVPDYCGNCKKCISACPTNAIIAPRILDARKCISYLTIETSKPLPETYKDKLNNYIYGCDICQDVCPWNKKARNHRIPDFEPSPGLLNMTKKKWYNLEEDLFNDISVNSAMKRTGFQILKRNIEFIKEL